MENTIFKNSKKTVSVRGRVLNNNFINLPIEWHNKIDTESITVSLTPIGAHQNVIVKRVEENIIRLQSNSSIPINCYYHIHATRLNIERFEYEESES